MSDLGNPRVIQQLEGTSYFCPKKIRAEFPDRCKYPPSDRGGSGDQ